MTRLFAEAAVFQIPRAIREALQLKPGQKIQAIQFEGRIELIPVKRMAEARGFLKGINTRIKQA